MTDQQAEALRAAMPDGPRRLAEGSLACAACGVAVATGPAVERRQFQEIDVAGSVRSVEKHPVLLRTCDDCRKRRDQARALAEAHPRLAAERGSIVVERIEQVAAALAVVGHPAPRLDVSDHALARLVHHLRRVPCRYDNVDRRPGQCSPRAWAHVGIGDRERIRQGLGAALRERFEEAAKPPPVPVSVPHPNEGGCLWCGRASLAMDADQVAALGGQELAVIAAWHPITVTLKSLGGGGGGNVSGCLCRPCDQAKSEARATGQTAMAIALLRHLAATGQRAEAERLRDLVEEDRQPRIRGWAAVPGIRPDGAATNSRPWSHLQITSP